MDAASDEQRRIGHDIHDGVGQELTGLRYMAQTHAESLSEQGSPDARTAQRMAEWLETVQQQLRAIVRTLVHSMYEESLYADRCLHAGAMGYVNKEANPDEVIRAIREILAGRVYLSPAMTSKILGRSVGGVEPQADPIDTLTDRQLEIFRLIGEGLSAHQIANRLHISIHTVETHRENIKRKLKVKTVPELTRQAILWVSE